MLVIILRMVFLLRIAFSPTFTRLLTSQPVQRSGPGSWGPSSNGTKTWCFRTDSGASRDPEFISRVSEGSDLTALHRLGQAAVVAPVQVDVLVQQWGKTLDVLVPEHVALGVYLVEPERREIIP